MPVYKPDIQKLLTNAKLRINFKCCFYCLMEKQPAYGRQRYAVHMYSRSSC